MGYPFGVAFKYRFSLIVDDKPWPFPEGVAPASIYIYSDSNVPSRDQAAAGQGTITQTIAPNVWTEVDAWTREIAIAAILDPDPTSTQQKRSFRIAVNYYLQSAGQIQTELRALEMERAYAHNGAIATSPRTVQEICPAIGNWYGEGDILSFIAAAKRQIASELKSRGYHWAQVTKPDEFTDACNYMALHMAMARQRTRQGDAFDKSADEYRALYRGIMDGLTFEYDADNDKEADEKPVAFSRSARISR